MAFSSAGPSILRLFGVPGGSLNKARATYGFLIPFDLALAASGVNENLVDHGGFIFDLGGVFALQYNNIMIGYPDWVFVAPSQQFNPQVDTTSIIGDSDSNEVGIMGSAGGSGEQCIC